MKQKVVSSLLGRQCGEALRRYRIKQKMKQGTIAHAFGVSQSVISRLEHGDDWTLRRVEDFAKLFGVKEWEFLQTAQSIVDPPTYERRVRIVAEGVYNDSCQGVL